jgi:hypothetical protein
MQLDDLIKDLETINELPEDQRDLVVLRVLQFLTKVRDIQDRVSKVAGELDHVKSLNLPWKFETGEPGEDIEEVDVKIRDSSAHAVVMTDSGYYPPSAYCAEFITACANGWNELLWNEKESK